MGVNKMPFWDNLGNCQIFLLLLDYMLFGWLWGIFRLLLPKVCDYLHSGTYKITNCQVSPTGVWNFNNWHQTTGQSAQKFKCHPYESIHQSIWRASWVQRYQFCNMLKIRPRWSWLVLYWLASVLTELDKSHSMLHCTNMQISEVGLLTLGQ